MIHLVQGELEIRTEQTDWTYGQLVDALRLPRGGRLQLNTPTLVNLWPGDTVSFTHLDRKENYRIVFSYFSEETQEWTSEARRKARTLLLEHLSTAQRTQYECTNTIDIIGGETGLLWRTVCNGAGFFLVERPEAYFCIHPRVHDWRCIPVADLTLFRKIMLEKCERQTLREARPTGAPIDKLIKKWALEKVTTEQLLLDIGFINE